MGSMCKTAMLANIQTVILPQSPVNNVLVLSAFVAYQEVPVVVSNLCQYSNPPFLDRLWRLTQMEMIRGSCTPDLI